MSHEGRAVGEGLRERKRRATAERISAAAARLALERGMAATTIEEIAAAAEVGRASFFRYFDNKERAVAEGLTGVWLAMITDAVRRQPAELGPFDAVRAAFAELAPGAGRMRDVTLSQARLSRSSAALSAWTLQVYASYEDAIAEAVAPRFAKLRRRDPRPRLLGALVMAAIRLALDDWVAADGKGDLLALIDRNLASARDGI